MEIEKNNKLNTQQKIIMILIIIILLSVLSYIIYINFIKKEPNSNQIENNKLEVDKSLNIELDEIIVLVKDYYYKNNLVNEENLINWTITKSTYMGYSTSDKNLKYYLVDGEYSCKDHGNDCVYLAVAEEAKEKNEFKIYVAIDESQNEKKLVSIEQFISNDIVEVNENVTSSNDNFNKVSSTLKEFYEKNNLVDNTNLKEWNIENIQYIKKENNLIYYQVIGTFSCKDNSTDCLYFEQVDDTKNNNFIFNFDIILTLKENNNEYSINNIENNKYYLVEENEDNTKKEKDNSTNITKEKLETLLKQYIKGQGLAQENEISTWDITKVTYIGYDKNDQYVKTYKFEGKYSCKDGGYECTYQEQVDYEISPGVYPYSVYGVFDTRNNTLNIKQLYGGFTSSDHLILVNEEIK